MPPAVPCPPGRGHAGPEMHMQAGPSLLSRAQGELLRPGPVTPQRHIAEASSTATTHSAPSCTCTMAPGLS